MILIKAKPAESIGHILNYKLRYLWGMEMANQTVAALEGAQDRPQR